MKGFYKTTISLRYNTRRSRRINHRIIQLNRTAFFRARPCEPQRVPRRFKPLRVTDPRSNPISRTASCPNSQHSAEASGLGHFQNVSTVHALRIETIRAPERRSPHPARQKTDHFPRRVGDRRSNPSIQQSINPTIQFRTARRPSKNRSLVAAEVTSLKLDHASRITHSKSQSLLTSAATFNLAAARCSFPPRRAASWCSRRPRG